MKISSNTVTEYTIECDVCDNYSYIRKTDLNFRENAKTFFNKVGWKTYKMQTLCNECYKNIKSGGKNI